MFKTDNYRYYLPTLGQSWLIVLVMVFLGGLLGGVLSILILKTPLAYMATSITYLGEMIPPIWYIASQSRKAREITFPQPGYIKLNQPSFGKMHPLLFFVVIMFGVLSLSVVCEPLTAWMEMPEMLQEAFRQAFASSRPADMILSTVIFAPLCEEFLCRGTMLRGMLSYKSPVKAILWSAFIFAMIHMNPWQAIPAFALGCFFGWVYYKTHSLWACVFMHFVNNGMASVMSLVYPDLGMDDSLSSIMTKTQYTIVYFVALAILCAVIYVIYRNFDSNEKQASSFEIQADPDTESVGGTTAE